MAKKARAEAKRQKRLERNAHRRLDAVEGGEDGDDSNDETTASGVELSNAEIMSQVEELHLLYADGRLDLDTFDEKKASLMAQISVH